MILNKIELKIKRFLEYLVENGTTNIEDFNRIFPDFEKFKIKYDLLNFIGYTTIKKPHDAYYIRLGGLNRIEQYKLREISEEQNKIASKQTDILEKQEGTNKSVAKASRRLVIATFLLFLATMGLIVATILVTRASIISTNKIAEDNRQLTKALTPSKYPDLVPFIKCSQSFKIQDLTSKRIFDICVSNWGIAPVKLLTFSIGTKKIIKPLIIEFVNKKEIEWLEYTETKCLELNIFDEDCLDIYNCRSKIKEEIYEIQFSILCENCEKGVEYLPEYKSNIEITK